MNLVSALQDIGFIYDEEFNDKHRNYVVKFDRSTIEDYDITIIIRETDNFTDSTIFGYHNNSLMFQKSLTVKTKDDFKTFCDYIGECELMQKNMAIYIRKNELNKDFK